MAKSGRNRAWSAETLAVHAGEFVDPAEILKAHPDLAGDLRQYLAMHEVLAAAGAAAGVPPLSRVGEYRIVKEIGRGGMGVVYEAEQTTMRRRVALKVLFPSVTSTPPGAPHTPSASDCQYPETWCRAE